MSRLMIVIATLSVLLSGCQKQAPVDPGAENGASAAIEVTTAKMQDVTDTLTIPARVAPDPTRVVHVFSQVSGRLTELQVRPGEEVSNGPDYRIDSEQRCISGTLRLREGEDRVSPGRSPA